MSTGPPSHPPSGRTLHRGSKTADHRRRRAQDAMKIWTCWIALTALAVAADWPQFLGPSRDGIAPGPRPGTKVELLWKQDVGRGFAGPVIADGRVILFERVNDRETVKALDINTGKA